jgi:urea transport system substrate-binding protein
MGRVLVVEDDATVSFFVAATLLDEGYEVATARDGQEGLARVQEQPPDVVLLDYQLPALPAPQFVVAYRHIHDAPIVLMTAALSAQERCAEVRAEGCLPKPFDLDTLLAEVRRFALPDET